MEALIRTNIFLSREEKVALAKIAKRQGISAALLTRRILDAFLGIPQPKLEPIKFVGTVPEK